MIDNSIVGGLLDCAKLKDWLAFPHRHLRQIESGKDGWASTLQVQQSIATLYSVVEAGVSFLHNHSENRNANPPAPY